MRKGHNYNFTRREMVDHLIRKAGHQHSACETGARNNGTNLRTGLNDRDCPGDGIQEVSTEPRALFFVPADGLAEFL